jgi:hypothetical protein
VTTRIGKSKRAVLAGLGAAVLLSGCGVAADAVELRAAVAPAPVATVAPATTAPTTTALPVTTTEAPPATTAAPTTTEPVPEVAVRVAPEVTTTEAPATTAPAPTAPPATVPVVSSRPRTFNPPCEVEPLSAAAGLDPFYTQVCWAEGIPVVASDVVDGLALQAAADILVNMLRPRPDLKAALVSRKLRVGIIGTNQRAVDLPEYRDLPTSYPSTDWDAARAYGATPRRPLLAAPEENLICSAADSYPGQSVLTHEVGHTVLDMAVAPTDRSMKTRVETAYRQALGNPVYAHTYAMTNADEYWAEGVQDYFNASRAAYGVNGGGDGYDGPIASRAALQQDDPALAGLIAEVFGDNAWRPSCP